MYVSPKICVTDLSTIPLLPPQDEAYARQLQSELDPVSDVKADQISAVSHISLMSLLQSDTRMCAQFIHQVIYPCVCSRRLMGS